MRAPSAETQLRAARSELKRTRENHASEDRRHGAMLIGITRLHKLIGVNLGSMKEDDPWRPHIKFWVDELAEILRSGRG